MNNIKSSNKMNSSRFSNRRFNPILWDEVSNKINKVSRYYKNFFQYKPMNFDSLSIFNAVKDKNKKIIFNFEEHQIISDSIILINGNFNHSNDIILELNQIYDNIDRSSRICLILYNPYLRYIFKLAKFFKITKSNIPKTFITQTGLNSIIKITKFDLVSIENTLFIPFYLFGIEKFLNKLLSIIPFIRNFSLISMIYLRPIKAEKKQLKLSVLVPARNEFGNIFNIYEEIKDLAKIIPLELVFVEGNSTDSTWNKINEYAEEYKKYFDISVIKQTGKGKANAVRCGFEQATGELFTILDADLTISASQLLKFYNIYMNGISDFVNGNRLVYPMQSEAMKFLNQLGNIFFAKALSYVLNVAIGDSLCGTKLFTKADYLRFKKWRDDFGDFDPFGDFEILFPASQLKIGIIDLPVFYKNRTYGTTNIQRFRDGLKLLNMVLTGFLKLKI